jgi:uncharacterized protein
MTVKNKSKHKTLATSLITPTSLVDQSLGLLKHKTPQAMLLKTRFGIHTLFMNYPIDVVILDNKHRVVAIKENLKPNEYFVWNIKYNLVLELPTGTIRATETEIGDIISL